jgi:membrane-associated phospholipid phosphatase
MIKLQSPRDIVSPREGKRHGTAAPLMLGDEGFDESLQQVCDALEMAHKGQWPGDLLAIGNPSGLEGAQPELLRAPLNLYGSNAAKNLAMSVSMDKYWHLLEFLFDKLTSMGIGFKTDRPETVQLVDRDASLAAMMNDFHKNALDVGNIIFDIKYFWKKPRPEDYKAMPGAAFTIDENGAPGHWSYGAGHATFAGLVYFILNKWLKLGKDLAAQVMHECWTFAFGRTVLGVHFIEDNVLGFEIGTGRTT